MIAYLCATGLHSCETLTAGNILSRRLFSLVIGKGAFRGDPKVKTKLAVMGLARSFRPCRNLTARPTQLRAWGCPTHQPIHGCSVSPGPGREPPTRKTGPSQRHPRNNFRREHRQQHLNPPRPADRTASPFRSIGLHFPRSPAPHTLVIFVPSHAVAESSWPDRGPVGVRIIRVGHTRRPARK